MRTVLCHGRMVITSAMSMDKLGFSLSYVLSQVRLQIFIFTVGECARRPVYRLPAAGEGIPGCAQAEELPGPQSWTGNICILLTVASAT
jgi:hypothetical protein